MTMIQIKAGLNMTKRKAELLQMMKNDKRVIKYSINMPAMLHHDLGMLALERETKMSTIINGLILAYIKQEGSK